MEEKELIQFRSHNALSHSFLPFLQVQKADYRVTGSVMKGRCPGGWRGWCGVGGEVHCGPCVVGLGVAVKCLEICL